MAITIELDRTAEMMLNLLREKLGEEPEAPHPDRHDAYETQLHAMQYLEWQRGVNATRLMLSVRLVNLALDQTKLK